MTGDRRQTADLSGQEKYEATVLDFLEKETMAVQPPPKPKEYSDELNALVSDLLKQVIEEADQKSSRIAEPEKLEDLLAEFMTIEESAPVQEETKKASDAVREPAKPVIAIPDKKAGNPEASPESKARPQETGKPAVNAAPARASALFASPAPSKNGFPKIAIAIAGVLLAAGIAGYLYFNNSKNEPEPAQIAAAAPLAPPVDTETPQPAGQPAAPVENPKPAPPASNSRIAAENAPAKTSASAAKNEKPSAQTSKKAAAGTEAPDPAQQRGEPPVPAAAVAPPTSSPAPVPVAAPIEKPAAPAVSEAAKDPEAVVEKKPVPETASVTASAAAAPPEPKAAVPTAPKNAASAIPLVRANPQYPELAIRSRASSTVTLDVNIDSQGKVIKAVPISGNSIFYSEAIKAAMKWRYKPASIDGTNVPSQSKITFNFNLKN